ncbi:LysR substrate-binding domain-containing protein [Photobacterium satsumensis]|uniref:LysR substrate-binding domain-containing protein n=1 Tax=Photobacterium satsumensis TaxID=2910239 RepID=UPI003D0D7139
MTPKLSELELFVAVAEAQSFSVAAERKGIAPSVVSRTIKNLEHSLQITLFNRTTRQVVLTLEGSWLLEKSYTILDEHQNIQHYFSCAHEEPIGELTVDAATPFAIYAIAPLLPKLQSKYPKLRVNLVSNESNTELIGRNIDLAIRIGHLKDSSIRARKMGETQRGLYASPHYLELFGVPELIEDLASHQCLGFMAFEHLNQWPLVDCSGKRFIVTNPIATSNNGETLKQMAINHFGIVCLSQFTAEHEVREGRLIPVLQPLWIRENIPVNAVYYSEQHQSTRLRAFIDFLVENLNWS